MRFSVALCTYNGAKHLEQQLASIAAQSRLPCELVVCDDQSSDATLSLLEAFARTAPFPVHIHINSATLGSTKNFERAIQLCTGDWIALADQDDAWSPAKLERIAHVIDSTPDLGLVLSDAWLCGPNLERTSRRLWANIPFTPRMQTRFDRGDGPRLMLRDNLVTGATCAFRADLREIILPIPASWIHDAWIGFLAAAVANARTIPEPLIDYRQHAAQQIGVRPSFWQRVRTARARLDLAHFTKIAAAFEVLADRLNQFPARLRAPDLLARTQEKVLHAETRRTMRTSTRPYRIALALRELLLARYAHPLQDFAADTLL